MNFVKEVLLRLEIGGFLNDFSVSELEKEFNDSNEISLEQFLIGKGVCKSREYVKAVADMFHISYAEMGMLEIDSNLVSQFGIAFIKKHKIVPICVDNDGVLIMAIGNYMDAFARSTAFNLGYEKVDFVLAEAHSASRIPGRANRK